MFLLLLFYFNFQLFGVGGVICSFCSSSLFDISFHNCAFFFSISVAMTACTLGGDFTNTSFIDFTEIKSVYGLNKTQIENFKKNRKFTCKKPGLYFITAHVMSSSIFSTYRIVKNDVIEMGRIQIAPNRDGGTQNWHTGSGGAVIWLNTKDTLGLQVWGNKMYIGSFSCMTIIKH